jgi:signal transduction histidine kinase
MGALWPLVLLVAALGAVAFYLFQALETLESDRRRAVQALSERSLMLEGQTGHLSAEVQQLAIVEERERIGREMHDGLAQTLGLLNLQIEMVKGAAEAQDWTVAIEELALLDTYLSDAYSDVREVLSNLRHTEPQGEAFVSSLQDYLDDFGLRNQIEAVLVAEDSGGPVCFPPLVEVHLHRVIQEALTNVRRHAAASRVEVRIRQSVAGWDVVVSDDGTGFEVAGSGMGRLDSYGLLTMRERVTGLGGQFAIDSQPGKGTRVRIFVPCNSDR